MMNTSERCLVHPKVLGTTTTTPALRPRVDANPIPFPPPPPSALDHLGQALLGAVIEDIYQSSQIARQHAEMRIPPLPEYSSPRYHGDSAR